MWDKVRYHCEDCAEHGNTFCFYCDCETYSQLYTSCTEANKPGYLIRRTICRNCL